MEAVGSFRKPVKDGFGTICVDGKPAVSPHLRCPSISRCHTSAHRAKSARFLPTLRLSRQAFMRQIVRACRFHWVGNYFGSLHGRRFDYCGGGFGRLRKFWHRNRPGVFQCRGRSDPGAGGDPGNGELVADRFRKGPSAIYSNLAATAGTVTRLLPHGHYKQTVPTVPVPTSPPELKNLRIYGKLDMFESRADDSSIFTLSKRMKILAGLSALGSRRFIP